MIGKIVNGYKVMANIGKKYVLACNPRATEPWVIWRVDRDGDFYSGEYMTNKNIAVRRFRELGFKGYV